MGNCHSCKVVDLKILAFTAGRQLFIFSQIFFVRRDADSTCVMIEIGTVVSLLRYLYLYVDNTLFSASNNNIFLPYPRGDNLFKRQGREKSLTLWHQCTVSNVELKPDFLNVL